MRFKQVNEGVTTFYSDKLYEEEIDGTKTTWRAYIDDIAVISQTTTEGATIRYTHRDRLGSARVFTDHNGQVEAQRNFDPFGKPRLASGDLMAYGNSKPDDLDEAKTRRGFTDHEHLDNVELIHMNGRVYDYNLGRFMSVDPIIQSPTNSQSINPYSYIMNNPLSGTDPTGYAAEIEKEKIKVSVTGSRIKRTVGEKTTVTTTNDSGQVTNRSTQTVIGSNVAVTSTNFENGAATSSTSAVMNGKTMTAVSSSVTDIGSPATLSQSTSITTAEGSANWCYGGACRTGIMPNIDTRTIAQMDEGLENLNSTMSAVAGGFGVASMLKPLLTGLPKYIMKGADDKMDVFRAFGDDARAQGFSWTPIDPRDVENFRDAAGLPSGGASGAMNSASFLIRGRVSPSDIIKSRSALPLDGNKGGLDEFIIDPKNVELTDFSVLK